MSVKIREKSKAFGYREIIVEGRKTVWIRLNNGCHIELSTGGLTVD